MDKLSNRYLVSLLRKQLPDTNFINKLKILYRPYVCPFKEILQLIPPESCLMDIGCGSGMFLMLVAELCQPKKIAGIEISEELVKNARYLISCYPIQSQIEKYDGSSIPDFIAEYNMITMIDVFHHIPTFQQETFIEQLFSKMSKGSQLLFKDIDASAFPWIYFNKIHDFIFAGEIGKEWTFQKTIDFFQKIGFKLKKTTRMRTFVYPHFLLWLEK
ncbi:class I SAM-dependent methyltransferase [Raineya orbicola]|jgi:cyclopropane fatty-acyl-phospholipid synthase-like methyltransferase|uniref:Methyltransferase domain n=1 Tax=Raineya orbicola TaxID=2016530 RepID=A0A2N3I7N7_9BACT|nr:class I SAM-dependent methyltransferase [Raineya orbicola]PKQ66317.1 Methyltransferase domain [Raineya orbicola]